MTKDEGGPAFPVPNYINSDGETFESTPSGMSLRDYFAAKALQGFCAHPDNVSASWTPKKCAKDAYAYADAMLEERTK